MFDFYSVPTANGQRAAIVLEEVGADYRLHHIDLYAGEHRTPGHLAVNPMGRLPAIVDHEADGLAVYGTLAIGLYLADRCAMLMPGNLAERAKVYEWAAFVASDLGPALAGQFVFTVLAPERLEWAVSYFERESRRFLKRLDERLADREFLATDDYTLVDALAYPSVATSAARLADGLAGLERLTGWVERVGERPAVRRGMAAAGTR